MATPTPVTPPPPHSPPATVGPPTKHQLALMIWLAVFPTLTVLNLALGGRLSTLAPVGRTPFGRRAASTTMISPARIDNTLADLLLGRQRRRPRPLDPPAQSGETP